jgi:hypothetical protein
MESVSPDLSGNIEIKIPLEEEDSLKDDSATTLPLSSSIASSIMSMASTSTGNSVKEWVSTRRQKVKPWTEFVNTKRFN